MLTATRTIASCSTLLDKEIAHLLDYAETKLLSELPPQLKMTSYLRLCCAAIRGLNQNSQLSDKDRVGEVFDDSYSHLLQALCSHSSAWWKYCWSSNRGTLKSNDPVINKLLQPLEQFIEMHSCAYSNN